MNLGYLNKFFDKIYVISLKRSTERQEYVKKVFNGLNFSFFWGVDGKELVKEELIRSNIYSEEKATQLSFDNKGMTLNEIGCALSHIKVYEDIVENNFQRALIFEDDLMLNDKFNISIEKCFAELPEDWDLVYLGDLGNNDTISYKNLIKLNILYPVLGLFSNRFNRKHLMNYYPQKYTQNLETAGFQWGLHSYGITYRCAEKLVKTLYPIRREADTALGVLSTNNNINAFRVKEKLFVQNRKFKSIIGNRHNKLHSNNQRNI